MVTDFEQPFLHEPSDPYKPYPIPIVNLYLKVTSMASTPRGRVSD